MSNDLAVLIRKRASIKCKLTTFKNYLKSLTDSATHIASDISQFIETDILQLEIRIASFEELLSKYDDVHLEIITVDAETNLQLHCNDYAEFENDYFQTLAKSKHLLLQRDTRSLVREAQASSHYSLSERSMPVLSPQPPHNANNINIAIEQIPNTTSVEVAQNQNNIPYLESRSSLVKLPTLQMKSFNGDPQTFLSFFEGFKSLVHNNNAFDNVTRFLYLKSVLGAEPSKVIESLDVIPANYQIALNLIEKRYKNTRYLIHSHIKGIVDFPKIIKESAISIRRLADSVQAHLRALESLGEPIDSCSSFIQYLVTDKLDYNAKREWEIEIAKNDSTPATATLIDFLEKRARLLEKIDKPFKYVEQASQSPSVRNTHQGKPQYNLNKQSFVHVVSEPSYGQEYKCPLCKSNHRIMHCQTFLDLAPHLRCAKAKELNLCINCLRGSHAVSKCKSGNCRTCNQRHSTLLHFADSKLPNASETPNVQVIDSDTSQPAASMLSTHVAVSHNHIQILPTAMVYVKDSFGRYHKCIALLDSASMKSYMTIALCNKLQLPTTKVNIPISGISQTKGHVTEMVHAEFKSINTNFTASLSFLLLQNISGEFPAISAASNFLRIPSNACLANPDYQSKTKIDLLLGVDIFWQILAVDQPLATQYPYLWNTKLGYIVTGEFSANTQSIASSCFLTTLDLSRQLQKFWELENISSTKPLSSEEQQCELHFLQTHKRNSDGTFTVSIPLNSCPGVLGESKENAQKQFLSLERRLQLNSKLKSMYVDFMEEYKIMGHMSKVEHPDKADFQYFIPHHAVHKDSSLTTKLRVVFNSSSPTSTGISFNDLQLKGPILQDDLFSILLRFRRFKYILTSDCAKMYRSIFIEKSQRSLQRIFWRPDPSLPLEIYELCTVTYGERASSFLAIRCLFEIANLCKSDYPQISKIICKDMYCDDLLTSCQSIADARYISTNMTKIFNASGFTLRKWNSNCPEAIDSIQSKDIANNILEFGPTQNTKTLGLFFNSYSDNFFFEIAIFENIYKVTTKRTILSFISMIFDPLGLLCPCTITAKIYMQQLWLINLPWDQILPYNLQTQWRLFCQDLYTLNSLRIPRQSICASFKSVEIHAFSDGSKTAYGTCVYLRSVDNLDQVTVQLLCSKTRVSPLKTITIPKLELSGALLMAQLVDKVKGALDVTILSTTYWADSTIVLAWINNEPHSLETFVSNRVSQIQTLTCSSSWKYVPTELNPADLVTRGISANKLSTLTFWWEGPDFLSKPIQEYPTQPFSTVSSDAILSNNTIMSHVTVTSFKAFVPFERYSDLNKLKRLLAYCLRFAENCRSAASDRIFTPLTFAEQQNSLSHLARLSQLESFTNEIHCLSKNKPLPKRSPLLKLNPYYDNTLQVLRVGGRLDNSAFSFDKKHPILISSKHTFTKLLFRAEHVRLCHAGPSLLLNSVRESFWPINGRNLAKQTSFQCLSCFRSRPRDSHNLMGNLPADRLSTEYPFAIVGTDYCGPFTIKDKLGRGWKPIKCYICLFVCFSTKAVHLEPVTDLSSESFMICLRRFASRRGMPKKIYSDNGRNYCGAKSILDALGKFLIANEQGLVQLSANENFNWVFLPPYSPSLGGLWEAGVKSTKTHLKRVLGNAILSLEHFWTVLTQIEGVLNSRPLYPLSSHPDDYLPLTPSHFLIGRTITAVPDVDVSHIPENRLSSFQRIQQIVQNFWSRWSQEYASELQVRTRWRTKESNIKPNTLVLLKDANLLPGKWKIARVIEAIAGKDGVVRVLRLRTPNGETTRAVSKVCPIPLIEEKQD